MQLACFCVFRLRRLDDDGNKDPYGPNAGPEQPLPFSIGLATEQLELVALNQINKAAKLVRQLLVSSSQLRQPRAFMQLVG